MIAIIPIVIEIAKPDNKSWEQAFDQNLRALKWAIDSAPAQHLQALVDTESFVLKIREQVIGK